MACSNYYLISFSCTLLYKNFNFRIHGHCKITCKNDLYSCEYHKKNLNFVFMQNLVQTKLSISNECAISCKTGLVLIQKLCGILCKTTQLLRKRIDCFVETLPILRMLLFVFHAEVSTFSDKLY